jgi:threonine dehydrogenase-like Zn-dependent dehydrogenase
MVAPVRAMVLTKPKTLEPREFERPPIGPDEGLLRIEACGICGSDYEQYEGAQPRHEDYSPARHPRKSRRTRRCAWSRRSAAGRK